MKGGDRMSYVVDDLHVLIRCHKGGGTADGDYLFLVRYAGQSIG